MNIGIITKNRHSFIETINDLPKENIKYFEVSDSSALCGVLLDVIIAGRLYESVSKDSIIRGFMRMNYNNTITKLIKTI